MAGVSGTNTTPIELSVEFSKCPSEYRYPKHSRGVQKDTMEVKLGRLLIRLKRIKSLTQCIVLKVSQLDTLV